MAVSQFSYHVFLSHNSVQKDWVRKLAKRLRTEGLVVFFDEDSIGLGDDIIVAIEKALRGSRHVLLVLSPEALSSQWVGLELSTSLYRDPGAAARTIIPILRVDCAIPLTLARLRYLDARDDDFEGQVRHLLEGIDRVRTLKAAPVEPPSTPHQAIVARKSVLSVTGGTLRPTSEFYIEREADRRLSSFLREPNFTCTVWGARQVGKSSCVVRIASHYRECGGRVAYIDLSALGGGSLPEVLYAICRKIARDLDVPDPQAEPFLASRFGPEGACLEFLQGLGPGVLIICDEVDFLRGIGALSSFFRMLRGMIHAALAAGQDFRVLVASVLPPRLFITDELASPFNVGHAFCLQNFELEEARSLFEMGGIQISSGDFATLFDATGGQPFLTHVAAALIQSGEEPGSVVAQSSELEGPYGMHLQSLLNRIEQSPSAIEALRKFRSKKLNKAQALELIEMGVLRKDHDGLVYSSGCYKAFFEDRDLGELLRPASFEKAKQALLSLARVAGIYPRI